jgi:hypothetical protein
LRNISKQEALELSRKALFDAEDGRKEVAEKEAEIQNRIFLEEMIEYINSIPEEVFRDVAAKNQDMSLKRVFIEVLETNLCAKRLIN